MTECSHESESIYGLRKAVGKGPRLWAGKIEVSNGETVDTGLDTIEAIALTSEGTNFDISADTFDVLAGSVSGGVVTVKSAKADVTAGSEDLTATTDTVAFLIAIGTARGL